MAAKRAGCNPITETERKIFLRIPHPVLRPTEISEQDEELQTEPKRYDIRPQTQLFARSNFQF